MAKRKKVISMEDQVTIRNLKVSIQEQVRYK